VRSMARKKARKKQTTVWIAVSCRLTHAARILPAIAALVGERCHDNVKRTVDALNDTSFKMLERVCQKCPPLGVHAKRAGGVLGCAAACISPQRGHEMASAGAGWAS
jgi:hypothetical protein